MLTIKNIQGNTIISVPITGNAIYHHSLMNDEYVRLSFGHDSLLSLPEGTYIEYGGEKYSLLEPYSPTRANEVEYKYEPEFRSEIARWKKLPLFYMDNELANIETDWSITDRIGNIAAVIARSIKKFAGIDVTKNILVDPSLTGSKHLSFQGESIFDGLNKLVQEWQTEWWIEKKNGTHYLHLSRCQHSTSVALEVGNSINLPSVRQPGEGYSNRFYVYGSTRNITQEYESGTGLANHIVQKRLTLPADAYPGGYIDARPNLKPDEVRATTLVFDHIYPSSDLRLSEVYPVMKTEYDGESKPVRTYHVYYVKLAQADGTEFVYDPDSEIQGKKTSINFQTGSLAGFEFELEYHKSIKISPVGGGEITISNAFEILLDESTKMIIPNPSMVPGVDNEVVLFNIEMPENYLTSARQRLAQAAREEIDKRLADRNEYTFDSNPVYFFNNNIDLSVGQAVNYTDNGKTLSTRVLSVEKHLDCPARQRISIGDEKISGTNQKLKQEVSHVNNNLSVIQSVNDLSKEIQNSYGRTQKLITENLAKSSKLWMPYPSATDVEFITTDHLVTVKKDIVLGSKSLKRFFDHVTYDVDPATGEDRGIGIDINLFSTSDVIAFGADSGGSGSGGSGGQSYLHDLLDVNSAIQDATVGDLLAARKDSNGNIQWTNIKQSSLVPDLTGYATQSWVTNQGFLKASALTGYATESWVIGKKYITADALKGYATENWVIGKKYITADALKGYATENWVIGKKYITADALKGYATESWVDIKLKPLQETSQMVNAMFAWHDANKDTIKALFNLYSVGELTAHGPGSGSGGSSGGQSYLHDLLDVNSAIQDATVGDLLAARKDSNGNIQWTNIKQSSIVPDLTGYATQSWVTGRGYITASALTWAGITGKPTTLVGYGITDAPTKAGAGASGTWGIGISGNSASATKLQTSRTIWGQAFDGTGNVSGAITGVTSITSPNWSLNNSATNPYLRLALGTSFWYVQAHDSYMYLGANVNAGVRINGVGAMHTPSNITAGGNVGANAFIAGSSTYGRGFIELYGGTPFIDFHFNNSTADYTSRIIELSSGRLTVWNALSVNTTNSTYTLHVGGTIGASGNITSSGNVAASGLVSGGRIASVWDSGQAGAISCSNWFRSKDNTGWMNSTYGGGIYMIDSTYVRVSHNKSFLVSGNVVATGHVQIGQAVIKYDATHNALYVEKADGSIANFYSRGEITAGGAGSGTSSSGGGIVTAVYKYEDLGKTFSALANDTFNAYAINAINNRVVSLENASALSFTTSGSGNVVTGITKTGTSVTVTKGITALTAISKAMVEGVLTGNITSHTHTFANVTGKPTTLAGYGITDAAKLNHSHNYAGSSTAGGSATSALQLTTARTINGTSFNGTANITTANWGTARTFALSGAVTGSVSVNGGSNITLATALSTESVKNTLKNTYKSLDLRSLNADTWYPCTLLVASTGRTKIIFKNTLQGNKPVWATHANGFSMYVEWDVNGSGWGATAIDRVINGYSYSFASVSPCGGITQNTATSMEIIWLRGGGLYYYWTDNNSNFTIHTNGYSWANNNGSYTYSAPTRTSSQITDPRNERSGNISAATFVGALSGNAASATKLQTARTFWGRPFDGTGNVSGAITGATTGSFSSDVSVGGNLVTGTTIAADVSSTFRSSIFGNSTAGYRIKAVRNNFTSSMGMIYSTGLAVASSDTHFWINVPHDGGLRQYVTIGGGATNALAWKATLFHNRMSLVPEVNNGYNLGSTSLRWANVLSVLGNFSGTVTAPTFSGALSGNASSATKLQTARTIFGKAFDGTANVAGQAMVYGNAVSAGTGYVNGGIQVREAGLVASAQSSDQYAPRIGFHWGNRFGFSIIANAVGFKFLNQAETGYVSIYTAGINAAGNITASSLNINNRLNIDSTGRVSPMSTSTRRAGVYGAYDSTKIGHIWSMGTAYMIPDNGANFGNLYGLAYKHTNNGTGGTMAGGHQMVWCVSGGPRAALGESGIWTNGLINGARICAGWDSGVAGSVSCSNWFRSSGVTGWYNSTYAGGIYMTDANWVRTYNSKSFLISGISRATGASGYAVGLGIANAAHVGIDMVATTNGVNFGFGPHSNGNVNFWYGKSTTIDASTNKKYIMQIESAGTLFRFLGNIVATGEITAYSSSDIRLKENIRKLEALTFLRKVNTYSFDWKEGALSLKVSKHKHDHGFIAQEINQIAPHFVTHNLWGKGYLGIDQTKFIPYLVAGVNELDDEVTSLRKRVEKLEKEK